MGLALKFANEEGEFVIYMVLSAIFTAFVILGFAGIGLCVFIYHGDLVEHYKKMLEAMEPWWRKIALTGIMAAGTFIVGFFANIVSLFFNCAIIT